MKRRRVDGMVGEATGASQAGAAHRSGLGKTQDRMAWPAWVDAWAQPSSTEKSSSVLEKGISPRPTGNRAERPARPHIGWPGVRAWRPWNRRVPSARQVKTRHPQWSLEITLPERVTAPHRGVAGEPGCRYALDLPRHEGSNR